MSNTQHTPGPWATDGREAGWDVVGLEGLRVATVWREGPNRAANARLIAAAPDLLAALEKLEWAVTGFGDFEAQYPDEIAAARAAIAKARGQ